MACDTQVIHIHQDGTVDTETCELSKKANHRLLWVSESDQVHEIRFDDKRSPFTQTQQTHTLTIQAGGWVESGEIHSSAEQGPDKKYTYQVKAVARAKEVAADPVVIIQP
jgi:hypothetical protein